MDRTDRDWVAELKSEDSSIKESAVSDLRDFLFKGLRSAYARKGVDEAFCEDIAQDGIIRVLDKMDQFEGRSRFTTWAMSIAIRLAVSEFRRKHFKDISLEQVAGEDSLRIDIPTQEPSAESQTERSEILTQLKNSIETLSEKQRVAMQAILTGMPVDEIARRTDSNRNAVYKLIHDARIKIKENFDEAGYQWHEMEATLAGSRS